MVVRSRVGRWEKQYSLVVAESSFQPKIMFLLIQGFSLFLQKSPQSNNNNKIEQAHLNMRCFASASQGHFSITL